MYLIPKDKQIVKGNNSVVITLNLSQIYKVKRTPECKTGEYALLLRNDQNKFDIFSGYITYDNICNWFEMIKGNDK